MTTSPTNTTARKRRLTGEAGDVGGTHRTRDVPDLGHREQAGLRQSHGAVDESDDTDHQADHRGPVHPVDVLGQLGPDDRELAEGGVEYLTPQARVTAEDQVEDRHQEEEEREHGDEHGVRQLHGQVPGTVVAVLLDHTEQEGGRRVPPLGRIDPAEEPLRGVHGATRRYPTGPRVGAAAG